MSNLIQFFRDVEKKTINKRKTHGGLITPIAIMIGILSTVYFTHNSIFTSTVQFIIIQAVFVAVFSIFFYIVGNVGLLLWAFSELSYPPVKGWNANFKRIIKIFLHLPNANQILRVIELLNYVIQTNGFENFASATKFMKDMYDARDEQNKEIANLKSRLDVLETEKSEKDQIINEKTQTQNTEHE